VTGTRETAGGSWAVRARGLLAALVFALVSGCATTNGGDPRDPFEGFNRSMYSFNDGLDTVVVRPVSTAYKAITPDPVRTWVRNFFANIEDVFIGVNNMLQGKFVDGWTDWVRFAFNTTLGVAGINDVASEMGLEKHNEDFGQTFGRWGIGSGPYLVLPLFGPSSVRDFGGLWIDWTVDPLWYYTRPIALRNSLAFLRGVSRRTDLLDASRILEEAALDKYVFQRDAYLQRRRALIHDGNPPRDGTSRLREEPTADAPATEPGVARMRASDQVLEVPAVEPSAVVAAGQGER
jgi:phospholipid-binding lipoprotein MlaA